MDFDFLPLFDEVVSYLDTRLHRPSHKCPDQNMLKEFLMTADNAVHISFDDSDGPQNYYHGMKECPN